MSPKLHDAEPYVLVMGVKIIECFKNSFINTNSIKHNHKSLDCPENKKVKNSKFIEILDAKKFETQQSIVSFVAPSTGQIKLNVHFFKIVPGSAGHFS